ncbi:MAG TPA: GNAT family N-acetyltransferase [Micromonosporaceae bacterium]|nr:GNAT family N-acetyltransferase [Micromonosporaceae bacterium]
MTDLEIRPMRYGAAVVQALVEDAMADLTQRYGSGDETRIDAMDFDPPDGAFLVAYSAGQPVACGGWRSRDDDAGLAEIKRMYTRPQARGRGIARAVLTALEDSARDAGRGRMILETGERQPEAISLYRTAGYQRIANFGHYRDEPDCLSFGKDL